MSRPDRTTSWTMIEGAAAGSEADRRRFAERYLDVVRAYLGARWRGTPLLGEVDDAVQEVFVEAFREGGALSRLDASQRDSFRPFFYGVVRNVARRAEARRAQRCENDAGGLTAIGDTAADEQRLSQVFDRSWAQTIMRAAARRMSERAAERGAEAQRRVELLRLRFHDDIPIREIARLWQADATQLHREYAKAREGFREALREVIELDQLGRSAAEIEAECAQLLVMLGGEDV